MMEPPPVDRAWKWPGLLLTGGAKPAQIRLQPREPGLPTRRLISPHANTGNANKLLVPDWETVKTGQITAPCSYACQQQIDSVRWGSL